MLLTLVAAAWMAAVAAQAAPAPSVAGHVVDRLTAEPLAGTEVDLFQEARVGGQSFRTVTDREGRFAFRDVPPGAYRLVAVHPGSYVPVEYEQRAPGGPGRTLTVQAGTAIDDLHLALTPTGVITGRVLLPDGQPVVRGRVEALRRTYRNGHPTMTIVQSAATDDRGRYRLFWLAPGEYFVSSSAMGGGASVERPGTIVRREGYTSPSTAQRLSAEGEPFEEAAVITYYPGTRNPEEAQAVRVAAGAERTDLDIATGWIRSYSVQGQVVDANGNLLDGTVEAFPTTWTPHMLVAWGNAPAVLSIPGVDRRSFVLRGLVPGPYVIRGPAFRYPIEIVDTDIANLTIVADPFELRGTIREAVGNPPGGASVRNVQLHPDSGAPAFAGTVTNGEFTVPGVIPGLYRLSLPWIGAAYLQSARFGSANVLEDGLRVDHPADAMLEIVIARDGGTISGRAVDDEGRLVSGVRVTLVPSRRDRLDLYRDTTTEAGGRFRLSGVAPGEYLLFAWESVIEGAWRHADFVRAHEASGTPIRIDVLEERTVDLAPILLEP